MPFFSGTASQSVADTTTSASIDTGLTVDSKTGLSIFALEVYWSNGESAVAADWELNVQLNTDTGTQLPNAADNICSIMWGVQNSAGVAVAVPYEPQKQVILLEPRLTVQPTLYIVITSALTGQTNTVYYRAFYETVKLTDLEVMRLLVGGA